MHPILAAALHTLITVAVEAVKAELAKHFAAPPTTPPQPQWEGEQSVP